MYADMGEQHYIHIKLAKTDAFFLSIIFESAKYIVNINKDIF